MTKTISILVIAIVLVGGYFLLNKKQETQTNEPIKIGAILHLTGSSAFQGENSQKAIDMAVEEINNSGGVLGRRLEMDYQDNQGDNPKGGLSAFYNLVNKGVKLIIGPNLTPTATALAPLLEKEDVTMISPSAGSEKFAEMSPRAFNVFPANKFDSLALAEYLYNKGLRKIAIFGSRQEWENDQANFVKQKFEELGGTITSIQLPTTDNKDLRTESLKIKSSNPEAVVFTNYGSTAVASKRLRDLGVTAPFFSVLLFQFQIDEAKGALENTVFVTTDTTNQGFNDKFKAKYGADPGFTAIQAYDALYVFVEGIKNAKSTNPKDVAETLRDMKKYSGVSGELTFDTDGNAHKPQLYFQVKNGVPVEIK